MSYNDFIHHRSRRLTPHVAGGDLSLEAVLLSLMVVDISGSMRGKPIRELNNGLAQYKSDIQSDPRLASTTLTSLFEFHENGARQVTPFAAPRYFDPPELTAYTGTPLCGAIIDAVNAMIDCRAAMRSKFDRDVRGSLMFVLTDGDRDLSGDRERAAAAQQATRLVAMQNHIHVYLIGCGKQVDMGYLHFLAQPTHPPIHILNVESFAELFRLIYVSQVHMSTRGNGDEPLCFPPLLGL